MTKAKLCKMSAELFVDQMVFDQMFFDQKTQSHHCCIPLTQVSPGACTIKLFTAVNFAML